MAMIDDRLLVSCGQQTCSTTATKSDGARDGLCGGFPQAERTRAAWLDCNSYRSIWTLQDGGMKKPVDKASGLGAVQDGDEKSISAVGGGRQLERVSAAVG